MNTFYHTRRSLSAQVNRSYEESSTPIDSLVNASITKLQPIALF